MRKIVGLLSIIFLMVSLTLPVNGLDDLAAMNAKAQALSWQDKLEEALELYQKVLARDPGNLTALNGQATVVVWQGYNRRGIYLYQQILEKYPGDLTALLGLAQVANWDGRDDLAVDAIRKVLEIDPQNQQAAKLYVGIAKKKTLYVNQFNYHSFDKNNLDVTYNGIRSGQQFDWLTAGELIYQLQRSVNTAEVTGNRIGLAINKRFSELVEFNTVLYSNDYSANSFRPFTTDTWLTLRPNDIWRLDFSYNRGIFEDVGSLNNKIVVDSAGLSADYKPNRFWLLSISFKKGKYSDSNAQNILSGRIEYRCLHQPYLKLFYNGYYSDWDQQLNSGYFNPKSILSQSLGVFTSINLTGQLHGELKISTGYENQKPTADHPTYFIGAGLDYRFNPNWLANLRAETFDATPDPNSNGYSKKSLTFGFTYNFATNPPELVNTQSPSRFTQ